MKRSLLALALAAVAIGIAACGGNGGGSSSTGSTAPTHSSGAAKVELENTSLGKVLADGRGRTLYLFEKDTGPNSTCFDACAVAWPPLTTTSKPAAGKGVAAAKLATISRPGGTREVTYNGHPLYLYAGDTGARQTNGQDLNQFGASWYVLSAAGNKIEQEGS